ncbi:MAG: A/G-specific adenine glycosylase [Bacteroidia bacterium]|jgi:A/G-specific adenine glycosylase|nr:A/G-specific adenine glycosylase [Bacteroidia bacterium]
MNTWFSEKLLVWYQLNKRDLPWREEKDPYKIWLSEIILQQTQVIQGLAYYQKFITHFPKVQALAEASENQVMKLWEGLGYYTRARNLHATAKIIASQYKGKFPKHYNQIRALKGVGDYTAAAIASFAFNLPHAVVDGNVYRVLSRVFNLKVPIDTAAGKKQFQELATALLPNKKAATYNQAIMEFGARYCKPRQPDCQNCIFSHTCMAFEKSLVESLPVKEKKTKVVPRYFNYVVLIDTNNRVSLQKRTSNDIWKGLYEFPLIESSEPISLKKALALAEKKFGLSALRSKLIYQSGNYKHLLSHQTIHACFYVFKPVKFKNATTENIALKDLSAYPFSQLLVKFLKDCELREIV